MARRFSSYTPRCPFCDRTIVLPKSLEPKRLGDFDYGACECGAVYVHDVTGHNLGAAMVEALGFACNDDWDLAWSLMPDEDYQDALLENYEIETNLIHPSGRNFEGRRVRGALSFIRLAEDIREVKGPEVSKKTRKEKERIPQPEKTKISSRRFTKVEVRKKAEAMDIFSLKEMAIQDPLVVSKLQRLLYSADLFLRWRAILSLGGVAGELASIRPAQVGNLVRSLIHSSNDSAASSWGAIEVLGEIIRNQPRIYGSFLRHILAYLGDFTRTASVLWAVGRIGELYPDIVRASSFFPIYDLLDHKDPAIRGHALWALGRIAPGEALSKIRKMINDPGELSIFDGEEIIETTVGSIAKEILMEMEEKKVENTRTELDEARKIYNEALILSQRGMSLDAMKKFEEALGIFDRLGEKKLVANICERLADIHIQRGNLKGAISPYQRALAICEKECDPISSVILLEKIIDIYRAIKEHEQALPYYYEALRHVESLKDAARSAHYLTGIGDICQARGEISKALDAYRLALKIYKGMGSRERAEILEKGISSLEKAVDQVYS